MECVICKRHPSEISEYLIEADEKISEEQWVIYNNSTYNSDNDLFCCSDCWTEIGSPEGIAINEWANTKYFEDGSHSHTTTSVEQAEKDIELTLESLQEAFEKFKAPQIDSNIVGLQICGWKVIISEFLPNNTMMVSPDIAQVMKQFADNIITKKEFSKHVSKADGESNEAK